ncbi:cell envelope integrity protein TolA [Duganella aceris]|uniref:Cell envelope integrity protein TolA n=1 Tax=Duganella aceris TaxID=2703883 RepID=A0ABX0FVI1_9BURK|nr:cell envelope integrity protein TolA [Duganella aceris]NGZ88507.1 cell envelope integrity protein TolA [Duganella aceris]
MKPATAGGPYKVPRQNEGWRSAVLAVAMHAVLLLFLWVGVSWQNNEPTEVQAEIWDMKVQDAAPVAPTPPAPEPEPEPEPQPVVKTPPPPPVEAPPTPKEPDIALERLKQKKKLEEEKKLEEAKLAKLKKEADEKLAKLEAKKLADKKAAEDKLKEEKEEKLAAEKAAAEKDKKKAAAEKLAKEKADKAAKDKAFAAEMARINGVAAKGSSGTAAQSTGGKVDGGYQAAIRAKIKSNLIYGTADDTLKATYEITQLPTGEIIGVRKVKGSGSPAYDSAIENAIAKSSPLPKKKDGTVEREFTADFNMKDMH